MIVPTHHRAYRSVRGSASGGLHECAAHCAQGAVCFGGRVPETCGCRGNLSRREGWLSTPGAGIGIDRDGKLAQGVDGILR
jgi:hypothetical protein